MKELLSPINWLPFAWVLIQSYLLLSMALFFLHRTKMLVSPVAGMEYGDVAIAASILLGTLLISVGENGAIFQAAKTLQYNGDHVLSNTLSKFTEFFLVAIGSTAIFLLIGFCNRRFLFKTKLDTTLHDGNTALGILVACVNTGLALTLAFSAKEIAERIMPGFVNFR